jgi:hypothetical protein
LFIWRCTQFLQLQLHMKITTIALLFACSVALVSATPNPRRGRPNRKFARQNESECLAVGLTAEICNSENLAAAEEGERMAAEEAARLAAIEEETSRIADIKAVERQACADSGFPDACTAADHENLAASCSVIQLDVCNVRNLTEHLAAIGAQVIEAEGETSGVEEVTFGVEEAANAPADYEPLAFVDGLTTDGGDGAPTEDELTELELACSAAGIHFIEDCTEASLESKHRFDSWSIALFSAELAVDSAIAAASAAYGQDGYPEAYDVLVESIAAESAAGSSAEYHDWVKFWFIPVDDMSRRATNPAEFLASIVLGFKSR